MGAGRDSTRQGLPVGASKRRHRKSSAGLIAHAVEGTIEGPNRNPRFDMHKISAHGLQLILQGKGNDRRGRSGCRVENPIQERSIHDMRC